MEDEMVCDNCDNRSTQFFEQNKKFFLSPCQHCFCNTCVERCIQANPDFRCRKCNQVVRYQELVEETKEVYEMKKIRDARKEVYLLFNAPVSSYKDPNAKFLNLQKEELFILRLRGKRLEFDDKASKFTFENRKSFEEGEAKRTDYESKLKQKIDEEKKFKKRKEKEYREKYKNKKGLVIDTTASKKNRDEIFYNYNNCRRIRPITIIQPQNPIKNKKSVILPYLTNYIMRRGLEELFASFS